MAVASFIFGGDTGETPESLRRKRKMLEALFGSTAAPKNVGEGLAALGNAFLFRRMNNQVNAGEQAGQRSASDAMAALFGGGDFPSAPAAGPAAKALFGKSDTSRTGSTIDFAHASDGASPAPAGGIEAYIREAAAARGIDPDVAVTVARSEGGLKDPVRQSLVRKNGRQEPSYGPFQLLIGGGDTGFPAGMGNDALAAGIDPRDPSQWQRGIDFALDNAARNGWGAWYGAKAAGIGNRQGIGGARRAPQQVASLDPSIGLPEAQEQPQQTAGIFVGRPDQMPPQQAPTPTPRPQQPVQQPAPQPQQVAQARQPMPEAEAEADALSALGAQPASSGPSLQQLYQAARNPWLSEQDRALVNSMIQQKTQEQDPLRQLQVLKLRQEIESGQRKKPIEVDGRLVDPDTYEVLADFSKPPERKRAVINGRLVDEETGELVADYSEEKPRAAPTVQKLKLDDGSELAVQWNAESGQWDPINAPSGGANVSPKTKLTESQSKLTLFQSLQTETQPVLLDLEGQFNPANIPDAVARSTPIAGNFFTSEQGQMYDSAATAWAEGALRIATGAAATPEEMERTKKAYFAQPGDTPTTIAFKAQMREMYNRSIQRGLGDSPDGGLPKPSDFLKQFENGANTQAAPQGVDPDLWDVMEPEERRLWQ